MALATLGLPIFFGSAEEDLLTFIDLYIGYLNSVGINILGAGPPTGRQSPIRNPHTEMIRFVRVLCAFLQIPYLNSVCFLKNQFFDFFFKKIACTEFSKKRNNYTE